VYIVVNDSLRVKVQDGGAWTSRSLEDIVPEFGNDLFAHYLEICEELMKRKAAQADYRLSQFAGYYCGHGQQMTHYLAVCVNEG